MRGILAEIEDRVNEYSSAFERVKKRNVLVLKQEASIRTRKHRADFREDRNQRERMLDYLQKRISASLARLKPRRKHFT